MDRGADDGDARGRVEFLGGGAKFEEEECGDDFDCDGWPGFFSWRALVIIDGEAYHALVNLS